MASYPDKKGEIKGTNLAALSITATRDGVLNQTKYKENKRYLPNDTTFTEIKGGNHAQFGSYGKQNGDRKATISEEKQTSETSQAMISWLEKIKLK